MSLVTEKVYTNVILGTEEKVRKFVFFNENSSCLVDVSKGTYSVDGKSILGVLVLAKDMPIKVVLHGTKEEITKLHEDYVALGLV